MNNMRFGFWVSVLFSAVNMGLFCAFGSIFSLLVGAFNAYVAYKLFKYA